jgi:hypothetical protein
MKKFIFIYNKNIILKMIENLKLLVKNKSYYSWEYDYNSVDATILLDISDDNLYLKMNSFQSKSGLGKGEWKKDLEFVNIGNLNTKIDTVLVHSLLKKYTISQHKFSKHWEDEEGNLMTLSEVFMLYKHEIINEPKKEKSEMKHIKSISNFDTKETDDIEIVKYSDKAYAIFGKGTKNIKDKLLELGCRYNKFLTDTKTGEKRAGWIFPSSKLDSIKKLI